MPTYAYACTACEHQFEAQQSFSDDALTECPECAGRLRKMFNSVGIVFRGSGFYHTDSRAPSKQDRIKARTEKKAEADEVAASRTKPKDAAASSAGSSSSGSGSGGSGSSASGSGSSGSGSSSSGSGGSGSGSSASGSGSSGSGSGSAA